MLVYMQALSGNTQKKPLWRRKLGDGGSAEGKSSAFHCRLVVLNWGTFGNVWRQSKIDCHNRGGGGERYHLVSSG